MRLHLNRVKAEDHAKALLRANGLDKAIKIAKNSFTNSGPDVEANLPNSSSGRFNVFFPNDTKSSTRLAIKERKRTHGFWQCVLGILNKQIKRK